MKFSAKAILIPTITLFIIATLVAAALAGTDLITRDKIAEVELANKQASCYTVLNLDSSDSQNSFSEAKTVTVDGTDYEYYEALSNGTPVGYAFITTGSGYGGKISIVTGIDMDGKITGVYCLDIGDETPGLGQNASGTYKDQFVGHETSEGELKVSKDGGSIDAMAGATITSRAVANAVSTAMHGYESIKGAA